MPLHGVGSEVGEVHTIVTGDEIKGQDTIRQISVVAQPGFAIIRVADTIIPEAIRVGSAGGIQNPDLTARVFGAAEPKIEPLIKLRRLVWPNFQTDLIGIAACQGNDVAAIKLLGDLHRMIPSWSVVFVYHGIIREMTS